MGFEIDVNLKRVLDLNDAKIRKKLGTTVDEILSPWLGYAKVLGHWPATWNLGKAVFDHGQIDGIRFPSDKNRPKGRNVLVLTSSLSVTGGTITIFNSDGSIREVLP